MKLDMKKYDIIREALISLLCVGEKINFIHRFTGRTYYTIKRYEIIAIEKKSIAIGVRAWVEICRFSTIEHYQGQLYIWDGPQIPRKQKIMEMIEILESKETDIFDYEGLQ